MAFSLWQLPGSSDSMFQGGEMLLWLVVPLLFVFLLVIVGFLLYRYMGDTTSKNPGADISDELEKQKEELLELAAQKKAQRKAEEEAEPDPEQKELREKKEKILERIDSEDYEGVLCPITGVELFPGDRIAVWVEEDEAYARPAVDELKDQLPVGKEITLVYLPERRVEFYEQEGRPD